mgnify:CR=1 FL=1
MKSISLNLTNFVPYHLTTYNWESRGKAEIDFIVSFDDILPLEAKAGINTKSKSLKTYIEKYSPRVALRTTLKNLKKDGEIVNIPLYALSQLKKLVNH